MIVSTAVVVVFALLLPPLTVPSSETQPHYGGIVCSEVRSNLDSFMAKDLDRERMEAIEVHLSECPKCRQRMEAMLKTDVAASDNRIPESFALGSLHHSPVLVASVK